MHANLDYALDQVLKDEGGYVDNPKDPGGPTNRGVTLANFKRYVDPKGTVVGLKALTEAQARTVFERQYWDPIRGDALPAGLDYVMFDFAILSGPKRAAEFLQRAVGATVDGVIGPATLTALASLNPAVIVEQIMDAREAWMRKLPTWPTFGKGWKARLDRVRAKALELATAQPVELPTPPDAPLPVQPAPTPVVLHLPPGFAIGAYLGLVIIAILWWFFGR